MVFNLGAETDYHDSVCSGKRRNMTTFRAARMYFYFIPVSSFPMIFTAILLLQKIFISTSANTSLYVYR
jgi:hypothetical protein